MLTLGLPFRVQKIVLTAFIHSFNKCSLWEYYVPGPGLSGGDAMTMVPALTEFQIH